MGLMIAMRAAFIEKWFKAADLGQAERDAADAALLRFAHYYALALTGKKPSDLGLSGWGLPKSPHDCSERMSDADVAEWNRWTVCGECGRLHDPDYKHGGP